MISLLCFVPGVGLHPQGMQAVWSNDVSKSIIRKVGFSVWEKAFIHTPSTSITSRFGELSGMDEQGEAWLGGR